MASLGPYDASVYTGTWTNWAHGSVLGLTLTTTHRGGSFLVAFVSLFVAIVGTSFWRIGCFVIHHLYSTDRSRGGLYHQRQAVLRNAANGATGLWSFLWILLAWRKIAQRPYRQMLPPFTFAWVTLAVFAVASTFSSRISSITGNEVLLAGRGGCSMLEFTAGSGAAELVFYLPPISSALSVSTEYVQQCYSGNSSGACGNFVKSSIPTKVNRTAACPFDPKICKTQDSNILLDTGYLDTRDDFGVNLKKTGRFSYRRVLHCAPLVTEGYQAKLSDINASAVRQDDEMFYFYGNTTLHNYTHRHPIGKWWKNFLQEEPGFTVTSVEAPIPPGTIANSITLQYNRR